MALMSKAGNLGEFEMLVLAALVRLSPNAYGVAVAAEIEARARRGVSIGALYTTLARLEEKRLVASRLGEATAERGGRAKRYYEVTAAGRAQLESSILSLGRMIEGIAPWPVAPKKN
jgi:DNA-binding PadR family transcriptional regulator